MPAAAVIYEYASPIQTIYENQVNFSRVVARWIARRRNWF